MSDEGPPSDMAVPDAVDRYLARMRRDKTAATCRTYRLDLRQFTLWCDENDIESISDLSGWHFELYEGDRAADLAPKSLENQMRLLKRFIGFCEDIELVEAGLSDKIHVPVSSPDAESNDDMLAPKDAQTLLKHFRKSTDTEKGSKWHALLEVVWHTGARLGGIRALDLDDYDDEDLVLEFRHRPKTGTPLKNKLQGERDVGLLPKVSHVLDEYIATHRNEQRDEHGRTPLFTTRTKVGRPSHNAIRSWMYQATQPCWYNDDPCPHQRVREECDWTRSGQSSQCPSSKSPHAVRTGSITWHRDQGFAKADVAERVNASLRTIEKHYDKGSTRADLEKRRREQIEKLQLNNESE